MRNRLYIPMAFLAILGLTGCQEEIDLDLPPNEPELVIEGYLVDFDFNIPEGDLDCSGIQTIPNWQIVAAAEAAKAFPIDSVEKEADYFPFKKVRLTTTSDYFSNDESPTVSNAAVRLYENGVLVETLIENPQRLGDYPITWDPDPSGDAEYHLEIDALGKQYRTEPELYVPTAPLIGVTAEYGPNFLGDSCAYYMGLQTFEPEGLGDNYRWMFYVNNKYVSEPQFISVTNDDNFDGFCIFGLDTYGDELELGDTLVVFQLRTNAEYTSYMTSLQQQTAFVGTPFDTPPAPIRGNVKIVDGDEEKDGFGYFSAGGITANVVFVPDTIPAGTCP